MGKSKYTHLDLSKRQTIENMLNDNQSAAAIGRILHMH